MAILIRYLLMLLAGLVIYAFVRSIRRAMQGSKQGEPELDMPYCQKCESNRNVVVNAGHSPDRDSRWYCTHCREGF